MLYLRSRTGLRQAIHDARHWRAAYGRRLTFARRVAHDGAFSFSVWDGTVYIGPMVPGCAPPRYVLDVAPRSKIAA